MLSVKEQVFTSAEESNEGSNYTTLLGQASFVFQQLIVAVISSDSSNYIGQETWFPISFRFCGRMSRRIRLHYITLPSGRILCRMSTSTMSLPGAEPAKWLRRAERSKINS